MTPEHADAIVAAADDMENDVSAHHGYSGRGMYGKTTSGVVGRVPSILSAVAMAASRMDRETAEEFAVALADASLDSMGRESIVY